MLKNVEKGKECRRKSKNIEERQKNVVEGQQNIGKLSNLKFNQLYLLVLSFVHEGSNEVETELK